MGETSGVKKKRPAGVTVIAILLIVIALLGVLFLLTYATVGMSYYYSSTVAGAITIITSPIFIALYIFSGLGLLMLKE